MIVVDTCGWFAYYAEEELAEQFAPFFEDCASLIVPTIIQFELYKLAKRERGEGFAEEVVGSTYFGRVEPLSTSIALLAADLSMQYKLAMADAIILATANQSGALLVTSDSHFQALPGVRFFQK